MLTEKYARREARKVSKTLGTLRERMQKEFIEE
jgi:hypothetical protein